MATLSPLLLLLSLVAYMSRVHQSAAAPTPAPSFLLGDPNTILRAPGFDASDASAWTQLFTNWAQRMNKNYPSPAAQQQAFNNFKAFSLTTIQHNSAYRAGQQSYAFGLHKYSDMTFAQFQQKMLGLNPGAAPRGARQTPPPGTPAPGWWNPVYPPTRAAVPPTTTVTAAATSLNYTAWGVVTPVKDQGGCGSCWAFGATGAIESAYFLRMGSSIDLSEEELVDCTPGSYGCNGGWPTTAYDYIMSKGGLANEVQYPYVAGNTGTATSCHANTGNMVKMALSYTVLAADDTVLLNTLKTVGPITVGMAVGNGFFGYSSGIMDPSTACGAGINHIVLLVGYGVDQQTGLPYWLCKNSWGTSWGDQGYFRLNRNVQNSCGINQLSSSVIVH